MHEMQFFSLMGATSKNLKRITFFDLADSLRLTNPPLLFSPLDQLILPNFFKCPVENFYFFDSPIDTSRKNPIDISSKRGFWWREKSIKKNMWVDHGGPVACWVIFSRILMLKWLNFKRYAAFLSSFTFLAMWCAILKVLLFASLRCLCISTAKHVDAGGWWKC